MKFSLDPIVKKERKTKEGYRQETSSEKDPKEAQEEGCAEEKGDAEEGKETCIQGQETSCQETCCQETSQEIGGKEGRQAYASEENQGQEINVFTSPRSNGFF